MSYDLLIVGSGLTGSTIARLAKDQGYNPLVVERRGVLGGNIRDEIHEPTGLRYNLHGPHYFRTNSERIWNFVNRFSSWHPWSAKVMTLVNGRLEHWPPNQEYVHRVAPGWTPYGFYGVVTPKDFWEACIGKMPPIVYEQMVRPYTEKQWGLPCTELLPSLTSRFEIREDSFDHRLTTHKYQALPVNGYSAFAESLLSGIDTELRWRYTPFTSIHFWGYKAIVFTGPIDELFGLEFGKLPYRSQQRKPYISEARRHVQVNYPSLAFSWIREVDWGQMSDPQREGGEQTLVTQETPYTPTDFDSCEYPIPTQAAQDQYQKYALKAQSYPRFILAGRLAEYRYLDMDQAIGRAMKTWENKVKPLLENR